MDFESEVRKETRAANVVAWIAGILAVLVLVAVFWPVTGHGTPGSAKKSTSILNTKQVALGMIMYAADWDEHLPRTSHWEDRLAKYLKTTDLVKLAVPPGKPPHRLAFNTEVSRTDISTMENVADTVLVFETDSTNKHSIGGLGMVSQFPGSQQSLIGFVDGHVSFKGSAVLAALIWKPTFPAPTKKAAHNSKQPVTK